MCKQLEISRAAYYKWLHREIPEHELKNIELAELLKSMMNDLITSWDIVEWLHGLITLIIRTTAKNVCIESCKNLISMQ